MSWVDRLPQDVAAVRFDLSDGTSTTVASQDGYVVLNALNPIGGAVRWDARDGISGRAEILRIYYLDTSGDPIAGRGGGDALASATR